MQATGVYDHISRRLRELRAKRGYLSNRLSRLEWTDHSAQYDQYLVDTSQLKNILEYKQRVAQNNRRVAEQLQTDKLLTPRDIGNDALNEMFRQTDFTLDQFYNLRHTEKA